MTDKPSSAPRVAAHKARGKYICVTISLLASDAMEWIQLHQGCSQREAIEDALITLAARLPDSAAMIAGGAP